MASLISRLRERQIVQWSLAYLAGAWLLLQVVDVVGGSFAWPPSVLRTLTVLLVAGLPIVIIVSWYHGEKGLQRVSGIEILMLGGILMIAATGLGLVRREPIAVAPPALPSAGESDGSPVDARAPSPDPRTIAVLPFANISADSGNEYFADGMTEELIGALARVPGLRVAARTSVFALKGRQLDVREAGELLRAATVLEGSVRRDGQRLQVSAQLIDAREGYLIWGEEFDRDLADVFAVQDEIARAIVDALRIQLMPTSDALVPRQTENLEAYRAYSKGQYFLNARGVDRLHEAVRLFEHAIELDSGYARAWAGLAEVHARLGQLGYAPGQEEEAAARIAALTALELDSTLADAHRSLARIQCAREWKWKEAGREYQRALALDPQAVLTRYLYGVCLLGQGEFDAARPLFVGAYELDPLQPNTSNLLGRFYLETGQPDSAIHYLEESVELGPDLDLAHQQLGHAYLTGR